MPNQELQHQIQALTQRVNELENKRTYVVIELGPRGSKAQANVYGPYTKSDAEKRVKDFSWTRWTSAVFMEPINLTKGF